MLVQQDFGYEIIDKISAMVVGLDVDNRITLVNTTCCAFLGYRRDELLGMDWCEHLFRPQDRRSAREFFVQTMAGEQCSDAVYETVVLLRTGEHRLVCWHTSLLTDERGTVTGLLCTGEDISRQRRLEDTLRKNEERFRCFAAHISNIFFVFDGQGCLCDVNDQTCAVLGYSREELLSLSMSDIAPVFSLEKCLDLLQQEEQAESLAVFAGQLSTREGNIFPVEFVVDVIDRQGTPCFVSVVQNLGRDIRQILSFQGDEDILKVIIDTLPDIICIKDGEGRWLLANAFDLRLFGLENVNYRGRTDVELASFTPFYEDVFLTCMETDELAWLAGRPSRKDEHISLMDGRERIFDIYKIPLFDEDGRRKALVVTGRDITEKTCSKENYRRLFEQSPLPCLSANITGVIEKVNQALVETFGYSQSEIEGKTVFDFMTPESRKMLAENYAVFLETEELSGNDYEVIRKDGTIAIIQIIASMIRDHTEASVSIQCIFFDVTKQRQMKIKFQENEQKYQLLFEHSPVGFLIFDPELRVIDCNERLVQIMDTPRDDLLGLDLNKIADTRFLPSLMAPLTGEEGRHTGPYTTTSHHKSLYLSLRTAPLYDSYHEISGGVAIVEDITEKQRVEEDRARFMSAIEQTSETIVITDTRPAIEYVNPAFEQQVGYSLEEVKGKNPRILQSGQHDNAFYKKMWKILTLGQTWRGRLINRKRNGTLFEEDVTISPVRDREGVITNFIAVKRDVTREISLEKQLHQAAKMEAIGTLAGGIAHDFNNILSTILGYAEIIETQLPDDAAVKYDLGQIIAAGNRAADLVQRILTFSRNDVETLQPLKLQDVIGDTLQMLQPTLPANIRIVREINEECGSVMGNLTQIQQILINLVSNARHAMGKEGGTLRVSLEEFLLPAASPVRLHINISRGRWLDLEVSDTGAGMSPAIMERIFEPFFTTRVKGAGTGLGLSVVHGIVKSLDGEITVNSLRGEGSTFHVYLPVIMKKQKDLSCISSCHYEETEGSGKGRSSGAASHGT